jgi:hypothetical protein
MAKIADERSVIQAISAVGATSEIWDVGVGHLSEMCGSGGAHWGHSLVALQPS